MSKCNLFGVVPKQELLLNTTTTVLKVPFVISNLLLTMVNYNSQPCKFLLHGLTHGSLLFMVTITILSHFLHLKETVPVLSSHFQQEKTTRTTRFSPFRTIHRKINKNDIMFGLIAQFDETNRSQIGFS
jgi:hypothetical protein